MTLPYILTTTHGNTDGFSNYDITTGNYRRINLLAEPYFFSEDVLFCIDDYVAPDHVKKICLWSKEQIQDAVEKFSKAI